MTRTNYTAEFKAKLVLETLRGERELNEIAAENSINPNLLRNRNKDFLDNAGRAFDESKHNREACRKPANKKLSPHNRKFAAGRRERKVQQTDHYRKMAAGGKEQHSHPAASRTSGCAMPTTSFYACFQLYQQRAIQRNHIQRCGNSRRKGGDLWRILSNHLRRVEQLLTVKIQF